MSPIQQAERVIATQSPEFRSVYANNVQVITNFFDTAMTFNEMLGMQGDALSVEQKVRVVLSLAQVKLLAMSLLQQLEAYEKEFGVIQIPEKIIPPELVNFLKRTEEPHEG